MKVAYLDCLSGISGDMTLGALVDCGIELAAIQAGIDSLGDIVGSAVGLSLLGVDRIVCSPVPTGTGYIEIEHGRVSVPAPATAEILKGVPLAASIVPFELTTPTGAAIVKTVADDFGPLPPMTMETIGWGAGDRDLKEQPNVFRLIIGQSGGQMAGDIVWVLETNLDDIS